MSARLLTATSLSAAALLVGMATAHAHVSFETPVATAGSAYKAVLQIPHGCDGKATNRVTIEVPEGFYAVKPQPKAGWKTETTIGDYGQSYNVHGKDIKSGVTSVTWSGGDLPDDFYDEFVITGTLANFEKDTTLNFVTKQNCDPDAAQVWDQVPTEGQNPHSLPFPAPQLLVKTAGDHASHAGQHNMAAQPAKLGDLTLNMPTIRATVPGAKVGGGYITISNDGKENDRLISVTTPTADHVEIHEMSMENDVMKMRQLKGGLEIPAGKTVELKPGGYHLMLMQPVKPYVEGEKVPATLEFEKAGKVDVIFNVTSAKGGAAASEHSQH